jgi:8-amino-7-oxononanoate synthase
VSTLDQAGWGDWIAGTLEARRGADLLRALAPITPTGPVTARAADGRDLTIFSGNDYLGLAHHPEVAAALARSAQATGLGPRGSALVCGHTTEHDALAGELAALKGADAALLTPTGFAANLCALGALGAPGVAIFSDALNHASIIDGARLARRAGATVHVYRHADAAHLSELLGASDAPRKIIATDSVFSMDGDLAPLPDLARLARAHGALLAVDEAHATLALGPRGAGAAALLGVAGEVDLHIGTLSKAFGGQGGFVACSEHLASLLVNRGRAFVYSTALPSPIVAGLRAALSVATRDDALREALYARQEQVAGALGRAVPTPIVPILLGDSARALEVSRALFDDGFHVTAIRAPTVPPGTARLRVALSAAHSAAQVDALVASLRRHGAV